MIWKLIKHLVAFAIVAFFVTAGLITLFTIAGVCYAYPWLGILVLIALGLVFK